MAFGYGYPAYQPPMYQVPNPAPYQQQIGSMPPQYQQQAPQQPVQAQMQPQANQSQPNVICRPVASEEEARATATPFDGSTLLLTDFGHGKIYCKSLNYQDGSAIFRVYQTTTEMQELPVESVTEKNVYATMSDIDELKKEIDEIKQGIKKPSKTAKVNVEDS